MNLFSLMYLLCPPVEGHKPMSHGWRCVLTDISDNQRTHLRIDYFFRDGQWTAVVKVSEKISLEVLDTFPTFERVFAYVVNWTFYNFRDKFSKTRRIAFELGDKLGFGVDNLQETLDAIRSPNQRLEAIMRKMYITKQEELTQSLLKLKLPDIRTSPSKVDQKDDSQSTTDVMLEYVDFLRQM